MFKIGDFSKLSRVSVRMLRYYDEMALLKPAQVDNFTGYRYYSASQLTRLNRILALRDLGLSLEQVAQLLNDDLSPEQLRGMLKLKRSELRQQLAAGQEQLERIERWLEQEEVIMPTYNVVLKQVEPLRVAQARAKAPDMQTLGPTLDKLFDAVMSFIASNGAKFTSPGITVYYDEVMSEQDVDVGASMGIGGEAADTEQVKVITLPGYPSVASTVHHGPFSGLGGAYQALTTWIEANHYQISGSARELNLEYERGGDQAKFVTEIQFPVTKA
jgi:DNA-binding transcriptional MerR regulator/effector-binding domain-containing protein